MLLGFAIATAFFWMIVFVVFGQVTVRKLRKNPATRHELGMEFMSGYDIFNVAGALALPRWLNRKLRGTPLTFLYANADILDKHTTRLDRLLAMIFYVLLILSASLLWISIFIDMFL